MNKKNAIFYFIGGMFCAILLNSCGTARIEQVATMAPTVESPPASTQTFTPTPSPTLSPTPTVSPTPVVPPTPTLLPANITSYELSNAAPVIRRYKTQGNALFAVAYADFDRDGYLDAFTGPVSWNESGIRVQLFKGGISASGEITWKEATREYILGDIPEGINPRKAIIADFNGDGYPDVYAADHGYDYPPYPGAMNILLLSDGEGHLVHTQIPGDLVGFHHAAAAGDIDNDGDADVFVPGFQSYFLINDGTGSFTRSYAPLPSGINASPIFTAELIDIDKDGFIDLVASGFEHKGTKTAIYWGDGSGKFRASDKTILAGVADYGIIVDIDAADINGDDLNDLIITRTGSPPNNEYHSGYYVQVLMPLTSREFVDESDQRIILPESIPVPWNWITWIKVIDADQDGDMDLVVNDTDIEWDMTWENDGYGYFTPK